MVYNVGDYLHVAPFDATDKVRRQRCHSSGSNSNKCKQTACSSEPKATALACSDCTCCAAAVIALMSAGHVACCRIRTASSVVQRTARHRCASQQHSSHTSQLCGALLLAVFLCVHTCLQDPVCSLIFNPSAVRDGHPSCHAYYPTKDGLDLLVGFANGESACTAVGLRSQPTDMQLQHCDREFDVAAAAAVGSLHCRSERGSAADVAVPAEAAVHAANGSALQEQHDAEVQQDCQPRGLPALPCTYVQCSCTSQEDALAQPTLHLLCPLCRAACSCADVAAGAAAGTAWQHAAHHSSNAECRPDA